MNAPATTAVTAHQMLPRKLLLPSKTNPRTRRGLDRESLTQLAASIKDVGIMQPLVIRPAGENYEIVAGERRWRAAEIAGMTEVPFILRDLTDGQVVKMQLIENVQREDLSELEEAEGYERLLKQPDDQGTPYTAERIAELTGKSKATIYARLKLLDLCEKAREALYDRQIDASRALLIARVSPEKIQLEALQTIIKDELSYRRAHELIQKKYTLELKQAIFDIKDVTLVKKVGSCTDCPKRSGNQPELFSDIKSKDVCTDSVCYAMKKAAHFLIVRNKAEADGAKIISGKEAQKILPYSHAQAHYLEQAGLAQPTQPIPNDPNGRTWEQALKQTKLLEAKDGSQPTIQPTLIENPHSKGELIQTISIEQATKALRQAGFEITLRNSSRPVKTEKQKADDAKLKMQTKAENLYRERLAAAIHNKAEQELTAEAPELHPDVFRLLAKEIFCRSNAYTAKKKIAGQYLGENPSHEQKTFLAHLDTLTPQVCLLVAIQLIMGTEEKVDDWQVRNKDEPETMLALAAMHGIDAAALKTQAEDEIKTEIAAKQRAKADAKKPAPKKPAKASAAQKNTPEKPAAQATKKAASPDSTAFKGRPEWPFPTPGAQEGGAA